MDHIGRLDLRAVALGRQSAAAKPWTIVAARPITREDMVLLLGGHAPSDPKAALARISAPHHMLAKLIADGKPDAEVSAITGYGLSRIKTLRLDPAFSELVSHYEAEAVRANADVQAQILNIGLTASQLLQEQLETEPESFTRKELLELSTKMFDRAGHGPTSKTQISINDPSAVIERLRSALATEGRGRVVSREAITAEYTEVLSDVSPTPSPGAPVCSPGAEGSVRETDETQGPGGRGDPLPEQSSGSPPAA